MTEENNQLAELTAKYTELYGAEVPTNKKNDVEWIQKKIEEFTPGTGENEPKDKNAPKDPKEAKKSSPSITFPLK